MDDITSSSKDTGNGPVEQNLHDTGESTGRPHLMSTVSSELVNDRDPIAIPTSSATAEGCLKMKSSAEMQVVEDERDYAKKNKQTELMEKAYNLQCPFIWQANLAIETYGDRDYDLVTDCDQMFEETGFKFRRFIVNLIRCYHNFYKRLPQKCNENLEELENLLAKSSRRDSSDYLFHRINDALFHVANSCRIYLLRETNQKEKALSIMKKVMSYESMDDANKAGIWAIRANVFVEYGYNGIVSAVEYMKKAIELDPENPYWHFMKGMYLGRLRRISDAIAIPSVEELNSFESAIKILKDGSFYAFAAEVYLDTSSRSKKLCNGKSSISEESLKIWDEKLDQFHKMAAKYFEKSVDLKPNCAHLKFRAGKGFMKLPPPYQNLKLAYQLLQQGLELSPKSSYGNHAMAIYWEKIKENPEKAKKYLNVAINRGNFAAHLDMIRIKYNESGDAVDTIEDVKEMIDTYSDLPNRRRVLGELISARMFLEYDLPEACDAMKKLMSINSKMCNIINSFQSQILPIPSSIPLLDVILERIDYEVSQKATDAMEETIYKRFIKFCIDEDVKSEMRFGQFNKFNDMVRNDLKNREINHKKVKSKRKHGPLDIGRNKDEEYLEYYRSQRKEPTGNADIRKLQSLIGKRAVEKRDNGHRERKHKVDDHREKRIVDDHRRRKHSYTNSSESSGEKSSDDRRSSRSYGREHGRTDSSELSKKKSSDNRRSSRSHGRKYSYTDSSESSEKRSYDDRRSSRSHRKKHSHTDSSESSEERSSDDRRRSSRSYGRKHGHTDSSESSEKRSSDDRRSSRSYGRKHGHTDSSGLSKKKSSDDRKSSRSHRKKHSHTDSSESSEERSSDDRRRSSRSYGRKHGHTDSSELRKKQSSDDRKSSRSYGRKHGHTDSSELSKKKSSDDRKSSRSYSDSDESYRKSYRRKRASSYSSSVSTSSNSSSESEMNDRSRRKSSIVDRRSYSKKSNSENSLETALSKIDISKDKKYEDGEDTSKKKEKRISDEI